MILMIDNYDSFTYNLVQYLGQLGADVKTYRNNKITIEQIEALAPEAIFISPGPCTPAEAGISVDVIRHFHKRIPLLGVCLGHQSIGYAFGASIIRADRIMHGKTSPIHNDGQTIFKGLSNPFIGGRYHSLIIDRNTLPSFLKVTAETPEGEIMAIRHDTYPVEGIQFHPESILTPNGKRIIHNFLEMISDKSKHNN
jgi:anthranilate synthase/aminodeoxychorismate synthase-like glutamine amidotransferase